MESTIRNTTKKLAKGLISINEANKILLDLFDVNNQRELLIGFNEFRHSDRKFEYMNYSEIVDEYLASYFKFICDEKSNKKRALGFCKR